jgi:hypothetical protein
VKFLETNVDRILICLGVSGGSGGGTVNTLIKVAKEVFYLYWG